MAGDATGDQQRFYCDQCSQRLVCVREQGLDEALLVGVRRDPQEAAGDLEPLPVTRSRRYRDVNVVRGIQQFVQERSAVSGRKLTQPGQHEVTRQEPGLSNRVHQAAGGPQRGRDGHYARNRLPEWPWLRDWPYLRDGGSLPVDWVGDRPHAAGALLAADQQPGKLDEWEAAGIDGHRVPLRRAETLPGERLDFGARSPRDSQQAVTVYVREPGGQLVQELIRPMSHLGSITGREATIALAPAVREEPRNRASPA
jgi:hypothetical protein